MSKTLALPIDLSVGTFDSYLNAVSHMPKLTSELTWRFVIARMVILRLHVHW
jgi:hypothetical protein